jgi:hypothetical protein
MFRSVSGLQARSVADDVLGDACLLLASDVWGESRWETEIRSKEQSMACLTQFLQAGFVSSHLSSAKRCYQHANPTSSCN